MIQTVKPLMLETVDGNFFNANHVLRTWKNVNIDGSELVTFSTPDGCFDASLTKESYDLLTDSSAKPSKLDMQG